MSSAEIGQATSRSAEEEARETGFVALTADLGEGSWMSRTRVWGVEEM